MQSARTIVRKIETHSCQCGRHPDPDSCSLPVAAQNCRSVETERVRWRVDQHVHGDYHGQPQYKYHLGLDPDTDGSEHGDGAGAGEADLWDHVGERDLDLLHVAVVRWLSPWNTAAHRSGRCD